MNITYLAQVTEVLRSDVDKYRLLSDIFHNRFVQFGLSLLAIIVINMAVRNLIGRFIRRSVRPGRRADRADTIKRATTVAKVVQTAVSVIIWVIGFIFILSLLGANVAGLATGAGLISVVIGLGAQNIVKDFMNGIFVIIENQYGVGDIITVRTLGGWEVIGEVEDLSIRITKIRDLEGVQHIISNGAPNIISNNSARFSLVNISVRIGYTADIEKVKHIINEVGTTLKADKDWGQKIIEPISFWRINDFEEYAVAALMIGKVKPGTQYEVAGEFRGRLLQALKTNKIEVPISQVVAGKNPS